MEQATQLGDVRGNALTGVGGRGRVNTERGREEGLMVNVR